MHCAPFNQATFKSPTLFGLNILIQVLNWTKPPNHDLSFSRSFRLIDTIWKQSLTAIIEIINTNSPHFKMIIQIDSRSTHFFKLLICCKMLADMQ